MQVLFPSEVSRQNCLGSRTPQKSVHSSKEMWTVSTSRRTSEMPEEESESLPQPMLSTVSPGAGSSLARRMGWMASVYKCKGGCFQCSYLVMEPCLKAGFKIQEKT